MLAATSETQIGQARVKSTLVLERSLRGTIVLRDHLAFDTRFAAAASGKPEAVGHLFLLVEGRFVHAGKTAQGPVAYLLADDEFERPKKDSATFRTEGPRAHVVQMRFAKQALRSPIGLAAGPLALPAPCWDAARACLHDPAALGAYLDTLASAGVLAPGIAATPYPEEPERYRRLWSALEPLYQTYGGTTSIKQLASSLGMSIRQVGRDAKDLAKTFGFTGGYRDTLLILRLRLAALLLSAPEATVEGVAKLAGYGSAIAMARAFRDAKLPAPSAVQDELRIVNAMA